MTCRLPLRILIIWLACFLLPGLAPLPARAQKDAAPKHVLLLNSYHLGYLWNVGLLEGMHDILNRSEIPLRLRYEFMDAKHYTSDAFVGELRSLYKQKYRKVHFDVIIASDNDAFNFLRRYRDELFPGTPVVFCGVNNFQPKWLDGFSNATGIGEHFDLKSTMKLALDLIPRARHMVVVGGVDTSSRMNHQAVVDLMPQFRNRVDFIDLYGLDPDKLAERLHHVPRDSVLLYLAYYLTPNGSRMTVQESIDFVYKNSGLPMFSAWSYMLEDGMVGGKMIRADEQGRTAAKLAMRLLRGEKAEDIPPLAQAPTYYMFDYPMLKKFGIGLDELPNDSTVLNLDQNIFESNKGLVFGVGAFILYQSAVIIGLLISNRRRKRAEARLRHEENQLEMLLEFSHMQDVPLPELLDFAMPRMVNHMSSRAGLLFLRLGHSEEVHLLLWEEGALRHERESEAASLSDLGVLTVLSSSEADLPDGPPASIWQNLKDPVSGQSIMSCAGDEQAVLLLAVADREKGFGEEEKRDISFFCHDLLRLVRERLEEVLRHQLEDQLLHSQKLEALGTFTSSIAHDFNNILASIASCCELALDEIPTGLSDTRSDIRQALRSSQRGKTLIRRLLDFSRREPNQTSPVSLGRLAEESIEMIRPLLPVDIKIQADIHYTPQVLGDPDKLSLIIMNLLTNSIQAMSGKGTLNLLVHYIPDSDSVLLEVVDDGCGMPPNVIKQIFDPFFTTRPKGKGTGLGLSVVDGIIRSHGGDISVESEDQKGTRFSVRLPAADNEELAELDDTEETLPMGGDEHLLVVDDDCDTGRALGRALERLGYAVTVACSGPEALDAYGDGGLFSLVITDFDMPGMNGLELSSALQSVTPGLPVILITGFDIRSIPSDKTTLLAAGIRTVIRKPASHHVLARGIRALLDGSLPNPDSVPLG